MANGAPPNHLTHGLPLRAQSENKNMSVSDVRVRSTQRKEVPRWQFHLATPSGSSLGITRWQLSRMTPMAGATL